jgi:hypothetical protein
VSARRWIAVAVLIGATLSASSCGGGESSNSDNGDAGHPPPLAPLPASVVSQADGNCRWMLREVKRIGEEASHGEYKSGLELTTEGIAAPGLVLIRQLAGRQEALRAAASDPRFDAYVELFNPIIVLGEQRLEVGRENDLARAKRLQDLLIRLGDEQREAATLAGLEACQVDFFATVVQKAFGLR